MKTRETRVVENKKQQAPQVENGMPVASKLKEAVPSFNIINGTAKMAVKIKGEIWYFTGSRNA